MLIKNSRISDIQVRLNVGDVKVLVKWVSTSILLCTHSPQPTPILSCYLLSHSSLPGPLMTSLSGFSNSYHHPISAYMLLDILSVHVCVCAHVHICCNDRKHNLNRLK